MVPFVNPVIKQDVAGGTTVQVLGEASAPPVLLKAVIRIEEAGPTVEEAAAAVGVTETSVFPASVVRVGAPGANKVHCGYKVKSPNKVTDCLFVYVDPDPFAAVFQLLNEKPSLLKELSRSVKAVPAVKAVFAIDPLVTVLVS